MSENKMINNANPLLSIIATSYDIRRFKDIVRLLDSIKLMDDQNIEVIFVVEGSIALFDEVNDYIKKQNILQTSVLSDANVRGANASRNMGISSSRGEIVALVDDDVVLFPDWSREMKKTYADNSIIGVTGPAFPNWENGSMNWFPEEFSWLWGGTLWSDWHETDAVKDVNNVGGMNCSFRREAFEKAGGYLTSLKTLQEGGWFDPTGEEVEFSLRVKKITGKRIIFNPKVKVYHKIYQSRFRLKTIAKRSFRMGYLRRMSRKIYPDQKGKSGASSIEIMVVKRIFTRLLPETGKSFFKNPANAFRKLSVIFVGLGFTALGFMIYPFKPAQNLNAGHPPDLFVKSSIEYPTATGQIQPK